MADKTKEELYKEVKSEKKIIKNLLKKECNYDCPDTNYIEIIGALNYGFYKKSSKEILMTHNYNLKQVSLLDLMNKRQIVFRLRALKSISNTLSNARIYDKDDLDGVINRARYLGEKLRIEYKNLYSIDPIKELAHKELEDQKIIKEIDEKKLLNQEKQELLIKNLKSEISNKAVILYGENDKSYYLIAEIIRGFFNADIREIKTITKIFENNNMIKAYYITALELVSNELDDNPLRHNYNNMRIVINNLGTRLKKIYIDCNNNEDPRTQLHNEDYEKKLENEIYEDVNVRQLSLYDYF